MFVGLVFYVSLLELASFKEFNYREEINGLEQFDADIEYEGVTDAVMEVIESFFFRKLRSSI